jgi:beta-glucuronidase
MNAPLHLISNVFGRQHQSLNGDWHTIVDPYENGYYDYRYQPLAEPYGKNKKPASISDRIEYDFEQSPTLKVPGDWNSQRPELSLYEGTIWYQKSFRAERAAGRRRFLHFGAANYQAIVYVNGEEVGRHVGGFTPFEFEITDRLQTGENVVIVKVDDARHRDGVPTVNTDWYNFGGLTRDVLLVDVPRTFIKDYFVQLEKGSLDRIGGWILLDGPDAAGQAVSLRIAELGLELQLRTDETGRASFSSGPEQRKAMLVLWSGAAPRRYALELACAHDRVSEAIGFRSIATRGADLLLNGQPIFLRGISIHEQAPERPGRATSEADARKLLGWARELGCNFVRLAHYPHNEHMVRVAEELGLLVWSEVPVYWTIQWENPETYANAERQITEMVQRDKNRAAVILWSVSNETPIEDARNHFLRRLIAKVRELDPTRLLTAALERHYSDERTQVVDDPLGEDLDVLGVNQYVGWYDGLPGKCDLLEWQVKYEKPLVFSELGGDAKAGHRGPPEQRWTEDYQADMYQHQIEMMRRIRVWRGLSPWILNDFQSPRRPLPKIQDGWNRKGLVSDQGEKKQAFFILQKFYTAVAQDADVSHSVTPSAPRSGGGR